MRVLVRRGRMFTTTMICMNMHYDATVSSKLFNRDAAIKIYVHVLSIYYTFSTLVIPKMLLLTALVLCPPMEFLPRSPWMQYPQPASSC